MNQSNFQPQHKTGRFKKQGRAAIVVAMLMVAAAQADEPPELQGIANLSALRDSTVAYGSSPSNANAGALRVNALKDAAETMGFQSGARWRYQQIDAQLETIAGQLDTLYDFKPLMMHGGRVRPPVFAEANNTETLRSETESTASDTTFEIVEDAKVVVSPPSWRDYLMQDYTVNNEINPVMRPKDGEEKDKWAADARKGWSDGVDHADNMYHENLNRLVRTFRGMVRYHRLAEQKVVDVPGYAEGNLGVTVNGRRLDVNQRLFQISAPVKFNQDQGDWRMLP